MRLVAGCILILAAVILVSAEWLGRVYHTPSTTGTPQAMYLLAAATFLGLFGGALAGIGLFTDRVRA